MLNLIIKSKIRQGILKLFFSNKNKEFYLSEIAKIMNVSRGTTQREAEKLEKIGILKSEKKNNLRYFILNRQDPLFEEWESIIRKTIGIETELEKVLQKIGRIRFAFIFGSYAKGDFKSDSDIDLFIVGNPDEDIVISKIKKIEKEINREINYHIYSEKEFQKRIKTDSFLQNITKKYILLTKNKNEFETISR